MCFNDYPRACALGFEKVSPLQGFSLSINVSKMILRCIIVGFFCGIVSPRWAHYRNGCVKIWNGYNYVCLGCGAGQPHQNSSEL